MIGDILDSQNNGRLDHKALFEPFSPFWQDYISQDKIQKLKKTHEFEKVDKNAIKYPLHQNQGY